MHLARMQLHSPKPMQTQAIFAKSAMSSKLLTTAVVEAWPNLACDRRTLLDRRGGLKRAQLRQSTGTTCSTRSSVAEGCCARPRAGQPQLAQYNVCRLVDGWSARPRRAPQCPLDARNNVLLITAKGPHPAPGHVAGHAAGPSGAFRRAPERNRSRAAGAPAGQARGPRRKQPQGNL